MSDNLELWNKVSETDKDFKKPYKEGSTSLTAVSPLYNIKRATEQWGAFGCLWGVKDPVFKNIEIGRIENGANTTILLICEYTAILFYPEGEIPIESSKQITFNGSVDVHYSKKCATDALSKGLSKLGFSSDVYMAEYGDNENNEPHKKVLTSYKKEVSIKMYDKDGNETNDPFEDASKEKRFYDDDGNETDSEGKIIKPVSKKSNKNPSRKQVNKKSPVESIPEIDKKFKKAMEDRGYSKEKIKEHLGNSKIKKMIKIQVISNKFDLPKK